MFKRKPTDLLRPLGRALLDKGETYVYVVDPDFNVVHLSAALAELSGLPTEPGLTVHELAERIFADEPKYQALIREIHQSWAQGKHIRGTELLLRGVNGALVTARWNTSRLLDGRTPSGYVAFGTPVNSALQAWVGLTSAALDCATDGLAIAGTDGTVLHANRAATEAGVTVGEALDPALPVAERVASGTQATIVRLGARSG